MTHRIMQANCNVIAKEMEYENGLKITLSDIFPKVKKSCHQ
jgi:hypothetical protein